MTLFLDNDVLVKLASWDLLEDGITACGSEPGDVTVLPTTRFWLGLAGRKKCKYPSEVEARLQSFLAVARVCAGDPAAGDGSLPRVDNVDPGDAILIAAAAESAGSLLVTGDKRCILAVATVPAFATYAARLTGRVLCLEQVLLRTIDRLGFEQVKQRVVGSNQLALDTSVRAAFGSGLQADAVNACGSLERRVRMLANEAGGMLAAQQYRFGGGEGAG
ncbi:MAG: hypothetical protein WAT39_12595 [Planctomycetota bacterium]